MDPERRVKKGIEPRRPERLAQLDGDQRPGTNSRRQDEKHRSRQATKNNGGEDESQSSPTPRRRDRSPASSARKGAKCGPTAAAAGSERPPDVGALAGSRPPPDGGLSPHANPRRGARRGHAQSFQRALGSAKRSQTDNKDSTHTHTHTRDSGSEKPAKGLLAPPGTPRNLTPGRQENGDAPRPLCSRNKSVKK